MINKKIGLLALSMMAMGLAACGGGGNSSATSSGASGDLAKGESITYWCPETDTTFLAERVTAFKAAHPEFKGSIELLANVGEGAIKDQLTKDPEKAADLFEVADDNLSDCVKGRALTAYTDAEVAEMKSLMGAEAVNSMTVKGKVYGLPYRNDNGYVLAYDKSIVSDEQAKTVEGIIEACKAKGATFNFNITDAWYTFAPVWAAGGKTYTDDSGKFHSEIATQEIAKVVSGFNNILKDAGNTFVDSIKDDAMGAAENPVGAVIKWNNEVNQVKQIGDKLAITTLPSFSVGGKSYAMKGFQGFKGISIKAAQNMTEGKLITAKAFAKYLASDEVAELRLTTLTQGVSNKAIIAKTSLWTSKFLAALSAQAEAGNTVVQATGSSGSFWTPAGALGAEIKAGSLSTAELALESLTICQTAQNA